MPLPAAHFQSVPAAVKMVIASDLSLRGAKRRGALSAKREEVPLGCNLGKALLSYTRHCRGEACLARRCTNDSNRPP